MATYKSESDCFRYQNLARKAIVANLETLGEHYQNSKAMDKDERFELYKEWDRLVIDEAFSLLRDRGGELEDYMDQAVINVFTEMK